jgi:membrane carboxypeptidase/penicillin-binding protein
MEAVRRRLIDRFGEKATDGPNSVYAGGLWVRSPYDPVAQERTKDALRNGLLRFGAGRGWSGPVGHIDPGRGWARELAASYVGVDYEGWRVAVVIDHRLRRRSAFPTAAPAPCPRRWRRRPIAGPVAPPFPRSRRAT